jgi:hypothetical protein
MKVEIQEIYQKIREVLGHHAVKTTRVQRRDYYTDTNGIR